MSAPSVSVILPTHNRARLLRRAVDSALRQTLERIELIIVDDGSTDDTAAVVAAIDDPRVTSIRLTSNRGASAARNAGVAVARAALLAFLDSDDVWAPEKLERQVSALEDSSDSVGLCVCSAMVRRGDSTFLVRWRDEEIDGDEALRRIASGHGFGTLSWLARRDAIDSAGGFDESLPRLQDYELSIRIARRWRFRLMSDVLATVEVQPDSVSASAERYARAVEEILDRHGDLFARNPRGHSHMIFRAGKYYALEGRQREGLSWFLRALRVRPTNTRALAGALMCATGTFGLFRRIKYGR